MKMEMVVQSPSSSPSWVSAQLSSSRSRSAQGGVVSAVSAHRGLGRVTGASGQGSLWGEGGVIPHGLGRGHLRSVSGPQPQPPPLQPWPLSGPGLWGPAPILSCALTWGPDPTSLQDRGSVPGLLCPGGQEVEGQQNWEGQQSTCAWALPLGRKGRQRWAVSLCPRVRVPGQGAEGGSQPARQGCAEGEGAGLRG